MSPAQEFQERAACARAATFDPRVFTGGAQDALRIAAFAGFDAVGLARRAILEHRNVEARINARPIYRMMAEEHRRQGAGR